MYFLPAMALQADSSICVRAGLECAGYRSQSDLIFRDQTKSIIKRLSVPKDEVITTRHQTARWSPVTVTPALSIEEVAQKVFFDNFPVLGDNCKTWMESGMEQPSTVNISLTSVGLAALALVQKDPSMMNLARGKYLSAIRAISRTINCHQGIRIEQSIAGSYILSMFEMITCDTHSASHTWQKHVHGAAALLGYLCSTNGLPIPLVKEVIDIYYTTALACLLDGKLVPQTFLESPNNFEELSNIRQQDVDPLSSAMQLFVVMGTLCNLYASKDFDLLASSQLFELATHSDRVLQTWAISLPISWNYHQAGPQYVYQDVWFARMWNYYRLARILANRIIMDNFDISSSQTLPSQTALPEEFRAKYDQANAAISVLSQEIYGTLPFMFNSEQMLSASLPWSAALFFTTTLLQSLLKLTDRAILIQNWSSPTCEVLGARFTMAKNMVTQNLH
ncbi:hypothetical protein N7457_002095 [Penicillium paradoxum]|uniref:uncharacterized protein n=1 Tax=Penicillium paradoxum TaxID=176176 RepID=UPI00254949A8|nr:uncharacterized protein N7457_002095 [Penicillium paradoxum]KAJ5787105.1 hypothetical protein N7457_002095 [Penicillium paradoxum]